MGECGCLFLQRHMEPVSDDGFPNSVLGYAIHVWYTCPKCAREFSMAEVRDRLLSDEEKTLA
jgi:hypothetical protein